MSHCVGWSVGWSPISFFGILRVVFLSSLLPNHTQLMLSCIRDSPLPLSSILPLLPNTRDFSRFVYPALFIYSLSPSPLPPSLSLSPSLPPLLKSFLDASSHLYKRVRPSVRPYVRPSVRMYVCMVTPCNWTLGGARNLKFGI